MSQQKGLKYDSSDSLRCLQKQLQREKEPDYFHARAVSKGIIAYDQLKNELEYAPSATPNGISMYCAVEYIINRATATFIFLPHGTFYRVHKP
jgi:hypothetical protein